MAIADKQVSALLPLLATDLPGCGTADKLATLERTLVEFCRRSRCWREFCTVTLADGSRQLKLQWTCASFAASVELWSIDGKRVAASRIPFRLGISSPGCAYQLLTFLRSPMESGPCTVEVVGTLIPWAGQIEVPEGFMERYGQGIADGAATVLKRHKGKSYSDPEGSIITDLSYKRAIADACVDGAQSVGRAMR